MQFTKTRLADKAGEVVETERSRSLLDAFSALRHRNFRLFWTGQLISLVGTWMQTTGQAWLVLQLTKNAWLLGVVGALQFLPILIFGLFGGVLADRLPKRKTLLFTQAFAGILAATMTILVFTGAIQLWHVFVLAFLLGLTNALDMPVRQSLVGEMVTREDLPNAIALNSSSFNLARIVGPGIGGLIIAFSGEAPLFLLNALSFIPVIIGLSLIDIKKLHAPTKRRSETTGIKGTFKSLGEGLTYVARTPSVLLITLMVGFIGLFGINFNVVLPLYADDILKVGAAGYGFISSAFGIGSLIAALWMAWRNEPPTIRRVVIGGIFFGIFEALFAISHWYILSLLLIAAVGFMQITFSATSNTTLQTVTPAHLRGRIMSVYLLVFAGTTPIGNLFTGGLASAFGASIALLAGALISLLAAIVGWFFRKPAQKSVTEFVYLED